MTWLDRLLARFGLLRRRRVHGAIMAEYGYWRDADEAPPDVDHAQQCIHMGAMSAASNLLAALVYDKPAAWHRGGSNECNRKLQIANRK